MRERRERKNERERSEGERGGLNFLMSSARSFPLLKQLKEMLSGRFDAVHALQSPQIIAKNHRREKRSLPWPCSVRLPRSISYI